MGNILSTASNQQTLRIMTSQPALTPARTINSQQPQHRIVSVSNCCVIKIDYIHNSLLKFVLLQFFHHETVKCNIKIIQTYNFML